MSDQWYVDLIEDPELWSAAKAAWETGGQVSLEVHDRTALFSYLLAKHYGDRRPIYCLHGPQTVRLPGPPYFLSLSEDLVYLAPAQPRAKHAQAAGQLVASFPSGVSLSGFKLDRGAAAAGEMVGFTAEWRLSGPLPPVQFAVALVLPPAANAREALANTQRGADRSVQAFPIANGRWALGPSRAGTGYEQRGQLIIPSNALQAALGRERAPAPVPVFAAVAPLYSTDYQGWAEVGALHIEPRPLPRNGP